MDLLAKKLSHLTLQLRSLPDVTKRAELSYPQETYLLSQLSK